MKQKKSQAMAGLQRAVVHGAKKQKDESAGKKEQDGKGEGLAEKMGRVFSLEKGRGRDGG